MIVNIVDSRTRKFRWMKVKAIIEPTWHDNSCQDADQSQPSLNEIELSKIASVSVQDAITWAHSLGYGVTLYLYDEEEVTG